MSLFPNSMLGLLVFAYAAFASFGHADSVRSSIASIAQGDIVGQSDFQVNLRPPVENLQEIKEALAAVMDIESSKQVATSEMLAQEMQRMMSEEKTAIHNLVLSAFAPLAEKVRTP